MTTIIAVANKKGGVAKTTTTLSIGAALTESSARVLLIDLDAQANLTLAVGIEPATVSVSTARLLLESASFENLRRKTPISGLDILPANNDLTAVERFLPLRNSYEMLLRSWLEHEATAYDYVLLDCPPFLGAVTHSAMAASDLLIIPTQPEYFSIYALRSMISLIRKIRENSNSRLTYRLLLTLHDQRNRIHRTLTEQLRSSFGTGVFETIIAMDTKLRESSIAGQSILQYAPHSRAAAQYRALTQEIITYVKEYAFQPA